MKNSLMILFCCLLALWASSCVSSKKFKIAEAQRTKAEGDIRRLKADTARVGSLVRENIKTIAALKTQIAGLEQDTLKLGKDLRDCRKEGKLMASTGKATKEDLEGKLQQKQKELNDKEMKIAEKEKLLREKEAEAKDKAELLALKEKEAKEKAELLALKEKEAKEKADLLAQREKELQDKEKELQEKSKRVQELEQIINKQNESLNSLQSLISNALISFKSDELTVETRNGKVYVSMSDKLLFQSGSTEVDVKGKEALQKLAFALQKQPDIAIAVEGHTDNVPISSGKYADNWDLSVMRATSIIRILAKYGLSPQRVTASGRGEHFPVADNTTKEGRAKNRRTEIILSPKLDELMGAIKK